MSVSLLAQSISAIMLAIILAISLPEFRHDEGQKGVPEMAFAMRVDAFIWVVVSQFDSAFVFVVVRQFVVLIVVGAKFEIFSVSTGDVPNCS